MKETYFLGGITSEGFHTRFTELLNHPDYYAYILKGGPGTGKSTLMKKIAAEAIEAEEDAELFYCSSDPESLDAVVLRGRKIIVADGTAPHIFEPVYPGINGEIINLGSLLNKSKLSVHFGKITEYTNESKRFRERVNRLVRGAASVNSDIYNMAYEALNTDKLTAYCNDFAARHITVKNRYKSTPGKLSYRQLSALTLNGYTTMPVSEKYTAYTVKDPFFAASDFFLRLLAEYALNMGIDVTVSEFTLIPNFTFEYVLLKDHGIAPGISCISLKNFYDSTKLSMNKEKLIFSKKLSRELSKGAAENMQCALEFHNKTEEFYSDAMNWDGLKTVLPF
ncbi:MAG: hypothetical protein LBR54_04925 [Oscillospiraceae bacterium]|jgi:hypothetical protein|nr:hypothetical protein [Oscillospiraceae bacterium]